MMRDIKLALAFALGGVYASLWWGLLTFTLDKLWLMMFRLSVFVVTVLVIGMVVNWLNKNWRDG